MKSTSELLRIATAGSVDDGKSTLIGRLMYDTKSIAQDLLEQVQETSERRGDGYLNLALLTDGLRAEREQGITIDVAYRYFQTGSAAGVPASLRTTPAQAATAPGASVNGSSSNGAAANGLGGHTDPTRPGRKFIIADTPGHEQYTRNMVTGASTADLSIVLVDARKGVIEQTRRHSYIASLLRIPHMVVAINKMDLVDYDEDVYNRIVEDMTDWAARLSISDVVFIPISALNGDNVVDRSQNMPWYQGPSLLYHLEHVVIAADRNMNDVRFPVQWVIRPMTDEHHDYRGYGGQIAAGEIRPGHEVMVLPSGRKTKVKAVDTYDGEINVAFPTMSVAVRLEDEIDISRGDMIVDVEEAPIVARELEAMVCWMSEEPLRPGGRYRIKHTTRDAKAIVDKIEYRVDVNTLERDSQAAELKLNEIGRLHLRTSTPLVIDPYTRNRITGSFILIDEANGDTVAAGMIRAGR